MANIGNEKILADVQKQKLIDVHDEHPGDTALIIACEVNNEPAAKLLLKYGADPKYQNAWKWTAAHYAAKYCHPEMLELLQMHGADLQCIDMDDSTPLHWAATYGKSDNLQWLLKQNVKVNIKDTWDGNTPLHDAASSGDAECVRLLIENKAIVNCTNDHAKYPLDLAIERNHQNIISILKPLTTESKFVRTSNPSMSKRFGIFIAGTLSSFEFKLMFTLVFIILVMAFISIK